MVAYATRRGFITALQAALSTIPYPQVDPVSFEESPPVDFTIAPTGEQPWARPFEDISVQQLRKDGHTIMWGCLVQSRTPCKSAATRITAQSVFLSVAGQWYQRMLVDVFNGQSYGLREDMVSHGALKVL